MTFYAEKRPSFFCVEYHFSQIFERLEKIHSAVKVVEIWTRITSQRERARADFTLARPGYVFGSKMRVKNAPPFFSFLIFRCLGALADAWVFPSWTRPVSFPVASTPDNPSPRFPLFFLRGFLPALILIRRNHEFGGRTIDI